MNNKNIIYGIFGIIIVSIFCVILIHVKEKEYIMYNGVLLALTVDGENALSFPKDNNKYHVDISCDGGKYQPVRVSYDADTNSDVYEIKLILDNINKNGTLCNVNFITIDDDNKNEYMLTTVVQSKATQISSINNAGETDISYRYNGKNPNNYIWFNNEMWRIIGLIPTCTSSGCATKSNLVKIIRNESLGGYAYDASSTTTSELKNAWGSNTLYKLLNEYYYGKGNGTSNENGKAYCYGYYNSTYQPIPDCNFNEIGISNNEKDYFGTMIENVYWNTGKIPDDLNISEIYINETATQTVLGYVGLMTASDYGYAGTDYNNVINSSLFGNNTTTNWLYGNGDERTSIGSLTKTTTTIVLTYWGTLENNSIHISYAVRPVVYLDPSVYVISGEGTEENPYIIGM